MNFAKKTTIITDIDGTLGITEHEICETLQSFRPLLSKCVFCIVTGRSLKGLARIQEAIPHNVYVSPWGGGNILFYDGTSYTPIIPIKQISAAYNLKSFTCTMLPEKEQYTEIDESHIQWTESMPTDMLLLSAYQQMVDTGEYTSKRQPFGNPQITTGRGYSWLNVSPFDTPRLITVEILKQRYPDHTTIYLGDSLVDGDCFKAVDLFMTHQGSQLSYHYSNIITYDSFNELPELLMRSIRGL